MPKITMPNQIAVRILMVVTCSITSFLAVGCGTPTHMLYDAVVITKEHEDLVAKPKSIIGGFYEASADSPIIGSLTFDDALESQNVNESSREDVKDKFSSDAKLSDFKSKNFVLSDGTNPENEKVSVLMRVTDGISKGKDAIAVQVFVLNKKYAGRRLWIGSKMFLLYAKKTASPVYDSSTSEPAAPKAKRKLTRVR